MPRLMRRSMWRAACLAAAGVAVLAVSSPPAAAHVTVHSDEAVQGAFAEIAFRVPTESATASTVKLRVAFPADRLVESVTVQPHPGWTYRLTTAPVDTAVGTHSDHGHTGPAGGISKAVSEIEWSVTDPQSGIKPGEYDEFRIAAGPLPDTENITFRVVQTYSDGDVARWIDVPTTGGAEPQYPAPVLAISSAGAGQKTRTVAAVEATAGQTPAMVWWAVGTAGVALLVAVGAAFMTLYSTTKKKG